MSKQQQDRAAQEEAKRLAAQQKGGADLERHHAAQAAKTEEEQVSDEELARRQAAEAAEEEERRVEGRRQKAGREAERLPSRSLRAGTVVHLNGEPVVLQDKTRVGAAGFESEGRFAALLARSPQNFELNSGSLRLVYNPMNGAPLPLAAQKLAPEEMTAEERANFGLPPLPPAAEREEKPAGKPEEKPKE